MITWIKGDYKSSDGLLDYAKIRTIYIPTFIILGSKDKLAVPQDSYASIDDFPKELVDQGNIQYLELKNFAHIDLIFKKSLKIIFQVILKFLVKNTEVKK